MTTQRSQPPLDAKLLRPEEAGAILRVSPRTLSRWAAAGRITEHRTLGGHRRYLRTEIEALAAGK